MSGPESPGARFRALLTERTGLSEEQLIKLFGDRLFHWNALSMEPMRQKTLQDETDRLHALRKALARALDRAEELPGFYTDPDTTEWIPRLTELLEEVEEPIGINEADLRRWPTGGKNPAPRKLAEMVARAYSEAGKPITFGKNGVTGEPSTDFCRTVRDGLEILGVAGSWERAARSITTNT